MNSKKWNEILFFKKQLSLKKGNWTLSGCDSNRRGYRFYPVQQMPRHVSPFAPRFTPAPLIRLVRYYEQWLPVGDPGVLLRMGSFLQNTVTWDKNTLLDGKRKEKKGDYMILKANILSFKFPLRCLPSSKMFLHQVNVFLQRGTLPRWYDQSNNFRVRQLLYESFQSA